MTCLCLIDGEVALTIVLPDTVAVDLVLAEGLKAVLQRGHEVAHDHVTVVLLEQGKSVMEASRRQLGEHLQEDLKTDVQLTRLLIGDPQLEAGSFLVCSVFFHC